MKRKRINLFLEDAVPANQSKADFSPILPAGKWCQIIEFGGCAPAIGDGKDSVMAIQIGSNAGGWTTIRAWTGCMNFTLDRELIGDGNKKIRILRQNNSTQAKSIYVWLEAIIDDFE